jgi:hypothetical protein
MKEDLVARVGTFFILVGLSLLILFVGSIKGNDGNGIYLLLSFAAFITGWLCRRNRPVKDSQRFGIIHRLNERNRKRREEYLNKRRNRGNPGGRRQVPSSGNKNEEENNGNEG